MKEGHRSHISSGEAEAKSKEIDKAVAELLKELKEMPILLSNEEIRWVTDSDDMMVCEAVARTQLKKVLEWLEKYHIKGIEGDPSDVPAVFSDGGYRIPTNAVQALKKEAGDVATEPLVEG